jgi:hypothetical protein
MAFYPYIDKFVWADGGSTDGTVELLRYIKQKYDKDNKIVLLENTDCNIYDQTYVDLFNRLLGLCNTEIIAYIHPDMIPMNPEVLETAFNDDNLRWNAGMLSFTDDKEHIWLGNKGRGDKWITFNKNDYGLHYYGYYGDVNEDLYYSDITGDEHILPSLKGGAIPYGIGDSGLMLYHYCDAKPYVRRYEKMVSVMNNHSQFKNSKPKDRTIEEEAKAHPRVNCNDGEWRTLLGQKMEFIKGKFDGKVPEVFEKYKEFEEFKK